MSGPALRRALALCASVLASAAITAGSFAPVVPGYTLQFPRDFGSHPQFRIEWWYATGWLTTAGHETLGFQLTFFRTRPDWDEPNPSAFAPRELLLAHAALSDPKHAGLWHDQRVRRAGLGLAEAQSADTDVWIDDWRLQRLDGQYRAQLAASDFALDLQLEPTQPPLPNGERGFSRKGPSPEAASYYYSEPHLKVSGRITRATRTDVVSGEGWLDHEWSSRYLDPQAVGWDWVGLNLEDGAAAMAFRIRDRQGRTFWSAGTLRSASGELQSLESSGVEFVPLRNWRSPRSGAVYPVSESVRIGTRQFVLEPLLDDQENDARLSSGAIYWEGAVTALEQRRAVGRGYLELTGYEQPLSLR